MRRRHGFRLERFRQQISKLGQSLSIYQYCGRAIQLVWSTDWRLTVALMLVTILIGVLPAAIAYVGKLIVDSVVAAAQSGLVRDRNLALAFLGLEAVLVAILSGSRQGQNLCQSPAGAAGAEGKRADFRKGADPYPVSL